MTGIQRREKKGLERERSKKKAEEETKSVDEGRETDTMIRGEWVGMKEKWFCVGHVLGFKMTYGQCWIIYCTVMWLGLKPHLGLKMLMHKPLKNMTRFC